MIMAITNNCKYIHGRAVVFCTPYHSPDDPYELLNTSWLDALDISTFVRGAYCLYQLR